MVKAPKAKPRTAPKSTDRTIYRREWEANHPGFRLRFDSKDQLNHIKRAAEATSAPSVNEYILSAAIKCATADLSAPSVASPA